MDSGEIHVQGRDFDDELSALARDLGLTRADPPAEPAHRLIVGRRVLITGAGGTIGSALARRIQSLGPDRLALLDSSEAGLVALRGALASGAQASTCREYLVDIRRKAGLQRIFEQERPELVFHAAALKHVDICERNSDEAILTNCIGSRHVADAAAAVGASAAVLASTDKAVNPLGVMGLTKRAAELYWTSCEADTRFLSVRFGNVIGSSGSVAQLFREQIRRGGPVTVTHPEIRRYFISQDDAVLLMLQAAHEALVPSTPPPEPAIFMLEMGRPIPILDLARRLIEQQGSAGRDIDIVFTGLRPGEKLREDLVGADETLMPTGNPRIFRVRRDATARRDWPAACDRLEMLAAAGRTNDALLSLQAMVTEIDSGEAHRPAGRVRA